MGHYYREIVQSSHRGSGLGLAIVKQLVEAHGGQVQVTSQPGAGTQLKIPALYVRLSSS